VKQNRANAKQSFWETIRFNSTRYIGWNAEDSKGNGSLVRCTWFSVFCFFLVLVRLSCAPNPHRAHLSSLYGARCVQINKETVEKLRLAEDQEEEYIAQLKESKAEHGRQVQHLEGVREEMKSIENVSTERRRAPPFLILDPHRQIDIPY